MGLGRFGGGLGATRYLLERGLDVLLTDMLDAQALRASLKPLQREIDSGALTLRLGGHNVADFTDTDLVVVNPAVPRPWENRFVRSALAASVPVTTEIEMLVAHLDPERSIAITGSAGKSTTTAMTAELLSHAGVDAVLGGNIGGSLLEDLSRLQAAGAVVLELSSAQLYWLGRHAGEGKAQWWPRVAAITGFSPNHLDWHGSIEHYADSKAVLFALQDGRGSSVFASEALRAQFGCGGMGRVVAAEAALRERLSLRLPGSHNLANAAMAMTIAQEFTGKPASVFETGLKGFEGLPHRLSVVPTGSAVRVFNDSKCTTPEGAALAIRAILDEPGMSADRIVLIAGGADKGVSMAPMIELASGCGFVATIGTTGSAIAFAVNAAGGSAEFCGDLARAIERAVEGIGEDGVLLLSPGCASWDQFTNYQERGDRFAVLAAQRLGGRG